MNGLHNGSLPTEGALGVRRAVNGVEGVASVATPVPPLLFALAGLAAIWLLSGGSPAGIFKKAAS